MVFFHLFLLSLQSNYKSIKLMIRFRVAYLFVFFFLILASCSKDPLLDRMKTIQDIGDSNPQQALLMLDSIDIQVRSQSEYVKNKYAKNIKKK